MWRAIKALLESSHERMEQKDAQTRELIKDSNERTARMEARTMERFKSLEDRLVNSMQESNKSHAARMDNIHDELQRLKADMERDIDEKVNIKYANWEQARADSQAEYLLAKEEVTSKMKEIEQVRDKAKEMVGFVHEARNKYNAAIQETKQRTDVLEATIKKSTGQFKAWEQQMQRNLRTLEQVGDINTLLQSVEARQTEMEQV